MIKKLIFCFMCVILLTSCDKKDEYQKYSKEYYDVFDTYSTFTAYCKSQKEFDELSDTVYTLLNEIDNELNIYSENGKLKALNKNGTIKSKTIYDICKFGKKAYEETDGSVNIAFGSVLSLWHECREEAINDPEKAKLPDQKALERANRYTDIDKIMLEGEDTVRLEGGVQLDVGAIAKGYAADRVMDMLKSEKGAHSVLLNLGGNVAALNDDPIKKSWKIGIEDPRGEGLKDSFEISGSSAVTSGDYQRYYTVNGKRYSHIIDPDTLYPAEQYASVTVVCDSSLTADMLSTAIFILPKDKGIALADKYNADLYFIFKDGSEEKHLQSN